MSDGSTIEWTDASWNPVRGCDKVSAGCKNCYAETFAERWRGIKGHPFEQGFDLRIVPEKLDQPLRWKKPRKIFVNSMSDLFHEDIPNEYIAAVFGVMAACPKHTFQVLTKRAARLPEFFRWLERPTVLVTQPWSPRLHCAVEADKLGIKVGTVADPRAWPLPNVHLGVSAENQETADERIPYLLRTPAAVRWVSAEPLLGPIDFTRLTLLEPRPPHGPGVYLNALTGHVAGPDDVLDTRLSWVVVGGESGNGARPCDLAWIRSVVEQCKAAGMSAFVKQLGANLRWDPDGEQWWKGPHTHSDGSPRLAHRKGGDINEFPEDLRVREFPR